MKVVMLYRSNSEHGRAVEQYAREFTRRTNKDIELTDIDTKLGAELAALYDVVRYPTVLVMNNEGRLQKSWSEESLPLMDEVIGYAVEQ